MRGFLLDSHIPKTVAPALMRLRQCEAVHLSRWRAGSLLDSPDDGILLAAAEEGLVVVSQDIATMPHIAASLIASGHHLAGVVLAPSYIFAADVGALVRALVDFLDHPEWLDPAYPVVYFDHRKVVARWERIGSGNSLRVRV